MFLSASPPLDALSNFLNLMQLYSLEYRDSVQAPKNQSLEIVVPLNYLPLKISINIWLLA